MAEEEEKGFVIKDRRSFSSDTGEPREDLSREEKEEEPEGEQPADREAKQAASEDVQLPEVNFSTFVFSLSSSALLHFGEIPEPSTGKKEKNLSMAKHTIDILGMLEEKTKGKRQISFQFHPLEGRRFLTISLTLEQGDTDPTATVLRAIAAQADKLADAIVRLQLTLPAEIEGQVRDAEVRDALKEAHYFTIAKDIRRETRLRLGRWAAEEISPVEALKAYLETKKVSQARAKVLLEYGERLIRGEAEQDSEGKNQNSNHTHRKDPA